MAYIIGLPFENMVKEVCWMFCPRNMEAKFLHYFLLHPQRPRILVLLLQHQEKPISYNLLRQRCIKYKTYHRGKYLRKPVANQQVFNDYEFQGLLHVFLLPHKLLGS